MAHGSPAMMNGSLAEASAPRDAVRNAVALLKAVGHPLRFRIVDLLARRSSRSVTELCSKLDTKQPIISQQLSILRRGRVVHGRRNGNRVLYSLASEEVGAIVRLLVEERQRAGWSDVRSDA